jgi:uncharacterized Zn finger protein
MPRCPCCGYEDEFKLIKMEEFKFYGIMLLQCLKCGGTFNHYYGISPRTDRVPEFVIRISPRVRKSINKILI